MDHQKRRCSGLSGGGGSSPKRAPRSARRMAMHRLLWAGLALSLAAASGRPVLPSAGAESDLLEKVSATSIALRVRRGGHTRTFAAPRGVELPAESLRGGTRGRASSFPALRAEPFTCPARRSANSSANWAAA